VLAIVGLGACEVLIMISPFAGFFYAGLRFEPVLGLLSASAWTAWLDGFFLNHSVVTTSAVLELQRKVGFYLVTLGLWGFLLSAGQVYGKKLLHSGMATGLLYRFSRHPQYLCLGVAGWGLLTIWPRFLLLGFWVTMLFLYAALARFEEQRMEHRFGEAYRSFADSRGAFLPGNPGGRLFVAVFGRLRPRWLGWSAAYVVSVVLAFSLAGILRGYTRARTVIVNQPQDRAVAISAWPQPEAWVDRVLDVTLADERVGEHLEKGGTPYVVTILPARYKMIGMYYDLPRSQEDRERRERFGGPLRRVGRIALMFLVPIEGITRPAEFMGVDPDGNEESVRVVISRAEKPYKDDLTLDEALDVSVRLTPLVVAELVPDGSEVRAVKVPLPHNRYGPRVVMPLL
jgi:protein-S-isoprenylcysteine O-methyltransferase Ste14